jgi:predicted PurR-regulated permease PerM
MAENPQEPEESPDADLKVGARPEKKGRKFSFALTGLFVLALFYTLYLASSFFLPIVMAVLFALVLKPLVRFLHNHLRLPDVAGALVVLGAVVGLLVFIASFLFEPAVRWIQEAPQSMGQIEQKLQMLRGPLERFGQATEQVERLARQEEDSRAVPVVEIRSTRMRDVILQQTPGFLFSILLTIILVYFLLASGDRFLYDLVRSLPHLEAKRRAVEISREIEHNVSSYLATISLINFVLAVAVAVAMYFLGMPNAILWGAMAGLFNFIPYLGAMLTMLILTLVALITFDSPLYAMLVPAVFFALNLMEAYIATPIIVGRRLLLNPVMIFVGLMFWFWLWGIAGGLLAVPILAAFKIVCDHVPSLQPLGAFLGERDHPFHPPQPPSAPPEDPALDSDQSSPASGGSSANR